MYNTETMKNKAASIRIIYECRPPPNEDNPQNCPLNHSSCYYRSSMSVIRFLWLYLLPRISSCIAKSRRRD